MIKRIIFVVIFMLITLYPSLAQQVTIFGNAPDYAGRALVFYSLDNYFSRSEIKIGECTVSADGDFSLNIPVSDVRHIFIVLGVYRARFFVEPEFTYEVRLPPRIDKTQEEIDNPFFEETQVYMHILTAIDNTGEKIAQEEELNLKIIHFDNYFYPIHNQLVMDATRRCPPSWLDSCINIFRENIIFTGNRFFDDYVFYRSGLLYFAAQREEARFVSDTFFVNRPILYHNNAYMDLFNATYDRYFMFFGQADNSIYDVINNQGSFSGLKRLLLSDEVFPYEDLCELVILKNLHDEFYSNRFSRGALLHILDSAIVHSKVQRHREIADEIRSKITRLLRGFEPPDFLLYKHDSTLVSLHDYREKYLYIMFCTTHNYVCFSQYEALKELHRRHHQWLNIVVISADEQFAHMLHFKEESGYLWDFLHFGNDPDVLRKYDVRMFPTSFFIDPQGRLVLSPAPEPVRFYEPEPTGEMSPLERALRDELTVRGLWQDYIRRGLINN